MSIDQNKILESYPVFKYIVFFKYIGIDSYAIQNLMIVFLFFVLLLVAGYNDNSYFISGKSIGLLEHPTIWSYVVIQLVVPYFVFKSLNQLYNLPSWGRASIKKVFLKLEVEKELEYFTITVHRGNNIGKVFYNLFVIIGLIGFTWNSFQNQLPLKYVGLDFWDSINYPWGYWITRVYKFYLWVMLFPALAHIQFAVLLSIRKIILRSVKKSALILEPYHPDNCGGTKSFIDTVISPIIPVVLTSGLANLFAMSIHEKIDGTTIFSLFLTIGILATFYILPAVALNKAIVFEKKRQVTEIARVQNNILCGVLSAKPNYHNYHLDAEVIDGLKRIADHILRLPEWPQLRFVAKISGIAISPSCISMIIKIIISFY